MWTFNARAKKQKENKIENTGKWDFLGSRGASSEGDVGLIPGGGTKIPACGWHGQKIMQNKNKRRKQWEMNFESYNVTVSNNAAQTICGEELFKNFKIHWKSMLFVRENNN